MADATCKTCMYYVAGALDPKVGRCRLIPATDKAAFTPAKIVTTAKVAALMVEETFGCVLHEVNQ